MPLLSRLRLLLAFSLAVANALETDTVVPRAAAGSGCISDQYTACGGNLPSGFCCAADSTCVVTYGTSSSENTTAICCPTGTDCTVIAPITCSIQMLNVTAYPGSQVLSTELDTHLPTCAGKCCPPGYKCYQNTCVQSSRHVVTVVPAKTALSSSTRAPTATPSAASLATAAAAAAPTPTPAPNPNPSPKPKPKSSGTTDLSKNAVIGLVVASVACAILLAMLALCYRRHLLGAWRRFTSPLSSSRSTRSLGSSVKYTTTTDDETPPLQRPAPTWAIPLSVDWWWEPVKRQWPWVKPPWQSSRPSSRPWSRSFSRSARWPKPHNASTTFSTPLSSVNLPISRFNTHHDPETGIVTSPPSRSAVPKSLQNATKTMTRKNMCKRLSSGFYRIKSLPPIPQSSPAVDSMHSLQSLDSHQFSRYFSLLGESIPMTPQEVEGSPVPAAPKTPPSSHTRSAPSGCEINHVHNASLLPMPMQSQSPLRSSPWPRPLRLPRQPSGRNGYTPVSQATAHGRSVSDTLPFRQPLGAEEYGTPPVRHQPLPASPVELPATPVTARMLGASIPPLGHRQYAESSTSINTFGIISGSGGEELHQSQGQRPREYHRHTSYIPRGHNFAPTCGDPQPACPHAQSPESAHVETPMSYRSMQSLQSPTTPLLEEAQVQRLPRMAQARMMQQYQQPSIVVVVRPPLAETGPGSA